MESPMLKRLMIEFEKQYSNSNRTKRELHCIIHDKREFTMEENLSIVKFLLEVKNIWSEKGS